jgi:gluconokinase
VTAGPFVLALDVGTSSVKAALYDARAGEVAGTRGQAAHAPRLTDDGGAEFDAEALLGTVAAALDGALAGAGRRGGEIRAVGVATFWHSLVGADAAGRPVTPVLTWADLRAGAHAARLAERLDARAVHARTGCPLHPAFLPAKLAWLAETRADAWRAARWWGSFGEWLHRRLFARPDAPASLSMASASGLLDQREDRWDGALLGAIGLDAARLSPLGDLGEVSSGLDAEWAARWPALARVPWLPAVGDGATGQIGSGCLGPDRLALNLGTSSALRVLGPAPVVPPPDGLFGYRVGRAEGVVGGALNEGGNLLAWARETLRLPGREAAERALAAMPPDAHGLTLLPLLAGERAPGWRGGLTGAVAGLSLSTTPLEVLRALMEAVALRLTVVADRLGPRAAAGAPVIASGGAALASGAWRRILADALGRPVVASGEPEATSRGAALLALRESGLLRSFDLAPARLGPAVDPDADRHARYRAALERQQALDARLFGP